MACGVVRVCEHACDGRRVKYNPPGLSLSLSLSLSYRQTTGLLLDLRGQEQGRHRHMEGVEVAQRHAVVEALQEDLPRRGADLRELEEHAPLLDELAAVDAVAELGVAGDAVGGGGGGEGDGRGEEEGGPRRGLGHGEFRLGVSLGNTF